MICDLNDYDLEYTGKYDLTIYFYSVKKLCKEIVESDIFLVNSLCLWLII